MSEEGGVWRTVGGRRIFIKDGEDLATAMKNSGKFKNMFGKDTTDNFIKDREIKEVENINEMTKEVDKFIKENVNKYQMKPEDIEGEIHLEEKDTFGKKTTSFSRHYGDEINEYIKIYNDKVKYVTLFENGDYYGMKEKKTIDLKGSK